MGNRIILRGLFFFFYFGISAVHKIWKWARELCIYFLFCKILAKKGKRVQLGIILTVNIWLWISPWSRPMARRGTEKLCGSNPLKRELAWHLQQIVVRRVNTVNIYWHAYASIHKPYNTQVKLRLRRGVWSVPCTCGQGSVYLY